jgi:two-component system nitrate/nitrite sensor histidine kinase NarX
MQMSAEELGSRVELLTARLDKLIQLNRQLVSAQNESQLIESALSAIKDLATAEAVSFIPMDPSGHPLISYITGDSLEKELKPLADQLTNRFVQQQCKVCQALKAGEESGCPLLIGFFSHDYQVQCLPVRSANRLLGILNVFFPAGIPFDPDLMAFLSGLVNEMQAALQLLRFSNQEATTLRNLEQSHSSRTDLNQFLNALLENLRLIVGMDGAYLRIVKSVKGQPLLELSNGELGWVLPGIFNRIMRQAFSKVQFIEENFAFQDSRAILVAEPVLSPEGEPIGVICLARRMFEKFGPLQSVILHATASQAGMIIEQSQDLVFQEYKIVMQERMRLAREIHDGLAQTLAFLKLQLFQLQNMLARGDLVLLAQALEKNYLVVGDAYLEIREIINNLRFNLRREFRLWLDELISDFEKAIGLSVERDVEDIGNDFPPEIQVQLIRIIQEAFTNIRKHASACRIKLSLRKSDGDVILEIQDDGQGFMPDNLVVETQFGLRGMRERVELIGADFQITSHPDQGTIVCVRLPASVLESFA